MLGIEPIDLGEWMGWRIDEGMIDIKFSAKLATNGIPCLVMNYVIVPTQM
jgi:hypothetical protein